MTDETQAVAVLTSRELNALLYAIGALWATVVVLAGILWRIGAAWIGKVEAKIAAIEDKLNAVPGWITTALDAHNKEDITRHREQMEAIARNANAYTAPWAEMQVKQEALRERVESLEDTDRTDRPLSKRGRG